MKKFLKFTKKYPIIISIILSLGVVPIGFKALIYLHNLVTLNYYNLSPKYYYDIYETKGYMILYYSFLVLCFFLLSNTFEKEERIRKKILKEQKKVKIKQHIYLLTFNFTLSYSSVLISNTYNMDSSSTTNTFIVSFIFSYIIEYVIINKFLKDIKENINNLLNSLSTQFIHVILAYMIVVTIAVPIYSMWSLVTNKRYTITDNNRAVVYTTDKHLVTLREEITDDNVLNIYVNEPATYVDLEEAKIQNITFKKIQIIK